jgi:hypothetical protein
MFLELILVGACALLILRLLLKKPKGIYIQKTNTIFLSFVTVKLSICFGLVKRNRKSLNSWADSAIANPQTSEVFQSANRKSKHL